MVQLQLPAPSTACRWPLRYVVTIAVVKNKDLGQPAVLHFNFSLRQLDTRNCFGLLSLRCVDAYVATLAVPTKFES
jgi:hypothetical protein